MQSWARTPGDALVTPVQGLAGLSSAALGATPRPPTGSILRNLATARKSLAQATPLPRDGPAAAQDVRQDGQTTETSYAAAESRAEEDEFAAVLQARRRFRVVLMLPHLKCAACYVYACEMSAPILPCDSLFLPATLLAPPTVVSARRALLCCSHLLSSQQQDVMADVLDPRLAVGKFEQIARKQAAKLRESAGVNFHRCALCLTAFRVHGVVVQRSANPSSVFPLSCSEHLDVLRDAPPAWTSQLILYIVRRLWKSAVTFISGELACSQRNSAPRS